MQHSKLRVTTVGSEGIVAQTFDACGANKSINSVCMYLSAAFWSLGFSSGRCGPLPPFWQHPQPRLLVITNERGSAFIEPRATVEEQRSALRSAATPRGLALADFVKARFSRFSSYPDQNTGNINSAKLSCYWGQICRNGIRLEETKTNVPVNRKSLCIRVLGSTVLFSESWPDRTQSGTDSKALTDKKCFFSHRR